MNFADLIFRKAEEKDLNKIIQMLADDFLGNHRENLEDGISYQKAFDEIFADKNNFLAVVEFENEVIATIHLTLMRFLTRKAVRRMNIESVRVKTKYTNQGIGRYMMQKAIEFAKENDARIIQLTTDKRRLDVHRFYEKLGFEASHLGMKLYL